MTRIFNSLKIHHARLKTPSPLVTAAFANLSWDGYTSNTSRLGSHGMAFLRGWYGSHTHSWTQAVNSYLGTGTCSHHRPNSNSTAFLGNRVFLCQCRVQTTSDTVPGWLRSISLIKASLLHYKAPQTRSVALMKLTLGLITSITNIYIFLTFLSGFQREGPGVTARSDPVH